MQACFLSFKRTGTEAGGSFWASPRGSVKVGRFPLLSGQLSHSAAAWKDMQTDRLSSPDAGTRRVCAPGQCNPSGYQGPHAERDFRFFNSGNSDKLPRSAVDFDDTGDLALLILQGLHGIHSGRAQGPAGSLQSAQQKTGCQLRKRLLADRGPSSHRVVTRRSACPAVTRFLRTTAWASL